MGDVLMLLYTFHEFVIGLDNMFQVHTCLVLPVLCLLAVVTVST